MGLYGQPPPRGPLPQSVYWQRRVIVLILGGSLLGALALTANSMLSTAAAPRQAASTASTHPGGVSKPHAGRTARASQASRHRQAGQGARAGQGAGGSRASQAAQPGQPAAGAAPPEPGGLSACAARNVVLSLFTSRYWYKSGQKPRFAVDVVSVAPRPCRFDLGARSVSVVITWGRTRIWRSSDCVQGPGSRAVALTRGVPAVIDVTWNRRTSAPGCPGAGGQVHLGTYTATAHSGHLHSGTLVIVLAGPGVGAP